MIDEIDGFRMAAEQPRNDLALPDEEGGRPVTGGQLQRACGERLALFRGGEQDRSAAALCRLQRHGKRGAAGPLGGGEVEGLQIAPQIKGVGNDAGILAIDKREGR